MRILTERKVITCKNPENLFSGADASVGPTKGSANPPKKEKTGFFSKAARTERKDERKADKAVRVEKREKRRAERKAKYGARPLKQIGGFFKDHLPSLKKKGSGYVKTNPDGTETPVDPKNVQKVGDVIIDKTDASGKPLVAEAGKAIVNYTKAETVEAEGPDGNIQTYKATDTEENDGKGPDESKGMDPKLKWGLIIGGVVLGGAILWKVLKKK